VKDSPTDRGSTDRELEDALTELAWSDPSVAADPEAALASLGVHIPRGMRVDVRVQRRDTLYFVIPPAADDGGDPDHVVDQMDLWDSGDQFVWVLPQDQKVSLLDLREEYRRNRAAGAR
jgi:hypothetical protein